MTASTVETKVRSRPNITLPTSVQDTYERLSSVERKPLEVVLSERLTDCVEHNAKHGIWFGDKERGELEKAAGRNVATAADVVSAVRKAVEISVANVRVPVNPDLLYRLKSRCFTGDFDGFLGGLIREKLEEYVGLR